MDAARYKLGDGLLQSISRRLFDSGEKCLYSNKGIAESSGFPLAQFFFLKLACDLLKSIRHFRKEYKRQHSKKPAQTCLTLSKHKHR